MTRTARAVSWALWIVSATIALALVWGRNPDLLPRPPDSLAAWLIDLYGSTDGEQLADLEILYVLGASFALVVALSVLGWGVWRLLRGGGR